MADPFTADNPSILLGATELKVHASRVTLVAEDKMVDVGTFANPDGQKPSTTKWVCTVNILQSFGADGAWNLLRTLAKTKVTVVIKPTDAAVAVGNPSATFSAWMPSIPLIDSEIGEPTTYDLELNVVGAPVFATI